MTAPMAFPLPDLELEPLAPFWQAAQDGELKMPRCTACGRIDWYPQGDCRACRSTSIEWTRLSGSARLFSWTRVTRALDPRLATLVPYVSAIVTLVEDPASRLVTRLVDLSPEALRADLPLRVRLVDLGYPMVSTGVIAPLFGRDSCAD